ncbi:MAG: helix-turn-helix transcriptional regulator [Proteobacteria bacterium]|nr:helix-turn-helix transcriptional regulator [Pseudomonadota bacterium]MBQ9242671.1 helix-turn-helix transcriptional regulator [Pseudomonadota bacterium]
MTKQAKSIDKIATAPRCDCEIIHEDSVRVAKSNMLEAQTYEDLASLLKHFGDPTRVRILHVLAKQELCVCDLAALLNLTKSAISHQLKALRLSKLIRSRRDGQVVFYTVADDHVTQILNMALDHICEDENRS